MCPENKGFCAEADAVEKALEEYRTNLIKRFRPVCIILYGSRAKGTFTNFSDIDIIVISNSFEHDFISRIKELINANTSMLPIEPLGYTEAEFEAMLNSCRITALDAVREGIPLFGEDYFGKLRMRLKELEKTGLHKGRVSWRIPAEASG